MTSVHLTITSPHHLTFPITFNTNRNVSVCVSCSKLSIQANNPVLFQVLTPYHRLECDLISKMGIPYSREINAAFEQVTPLVAAGFKVLRTTKNISILLAIIQVLTVFFLFLILMALLFLLITVNPDLEHERNTIVTPALLWITQFSPLGLVRSVLSTTVGFAAMLWAGYRLFLKDRDGIEGEGNEDADKALEGMDDKEKDKAKKEAEKKKKKGGKSEGKEEEKK
jgi:hypothetical protein